MIAFNLSVHSLPLRTLSIFSTMSGWQTEISSANVSAISISDTHDLFMKKAPRVAVRRGDLQEGTAPWRRGLGRHAANVQQCIMIRYAKGARARERESCINAPACLSKYIKHGEYPRAVGHPREMLRMNGRSRTGVDRNYAAARSFQLQTRETGITD